MPNSKAEPKADRSSKARSFRTVPQHGRFRLFIAGTFLLATLSVAMAVGMVLYQSALSVHEIKLSEMAGTVARLVSAVAAFDEIYSNEDHQGGASAATLSQIEDAFGGAHGFSETGGFLLTKLVDGKVQILLRRMTAADPAGDHPTFVPPGSPYYDALVAGFAGAAGIIEVENPQGHVVSLAQSAVHGTEWVVVVEQHLSEIREPFLEAAAVGGTLTAAVVILGVLMNFRVAMRISETVLKAERQAAEAQRQTNKAEEQLQDALGVLNEGFALFDKDDRLVMCNDVYRQFFNFKNATVEVGRTLEDELRINLQDKAYPAAVGREEAWLNERLQRHRTAQQVIIERSDGRTFMISEQRTVDGGIVSVTTDVTDLKNREALLERSERRYRDFTETASDWVWETDADGRFSHIGMGGSAEIFDSPLIIGKTRQSRASEDTSTEKWRLHLAALNARQPFYDFRYWSEAADGAQRLISVSGVPTYSKDAVFEGYRGTGRDITDEYLANKKSAEADQRLRRVFENVAISVIITDKEGCILAFNKCAAETFRCASDEAIGESISLFLERSAEDRQGRSVRAFERIAKLAGLAGAAGMVGRRRNGELFPANIQIAEMEVDSEIQYIVSILDLAEEKELEEKLRQSQKMEVVGQLVGGVSHDFNNLLAVIIGNLELVLRTLDLDSRAENRLSKAMGAARRGADLTSRLLNFSRQMPTASSAADVNESLNNLSDLIRTALTDMVTINLNLEGGLARVRAEQGDFEDAITNLCINARDAMPDGGTITISARAIDVAAGRFPERKDLTPGPFIEIEVADTGIGMAPEVAAKVFEPFFSTKEQGKGTGLGLSMVYGFVSRCGGHISVHSRLGMGSTFRLYLPVATESVEPEVENQYNDEGNDYSGTGKILIVDDEEELAVITKDTLSVFGYQSVIAHDGYEALEILEKDSSFDLVLTDAIMPNGIDGYLLASVIKDTYPGLPICFVSGYTGDAIKNVNRAEEEYLLLKKPYTDTQLARHVRAAIEASRPVSV